MEAWEAAKNALKCVLEAEEGDSIVIFCDDEKINIGEAFAAGALNLGLQARLMVLKTESKVFREEIPEKITEVFKSPPAIYINLFRGVREETPFRIQIIKMETEGHKARLGHCPGVTMDMLTEGALALKSEEHRKMQEFAKKLMKKLNGTVRIELANLTGTKLTFSVEERVFFTDTIVNKETNKWMNLPTGEVLIGPVEDSMHGELVCDMAIGGIGPLETPVKLLIQDGRVRDSTCKNRKALKRVQDSLSTDENSSRLGEFAFGVNPKARFVEEFLEAEKLLGTIHIAFGDNADYPGGKNPSKNHMDFLISKPTVEAFKRDGSSITILKDGVFGRA